MQKAISAGPSFEPLEQSDPNGERRSRAVLAAHARVLNTGFELQEPNVDDMSAVGHIRPIRFDG
jgi:hypothetical protein